ncbi:MULTISPECIES: hypothetical protein [unclassified Bradyrhizobium]|uniref:hypothetical protein n=1 Tax=unclassified Bradyrhizobium TaxID=2631580 RepID=UPI0024785105|nr:MULTISPECIES: hypothetical protein [unclassified Bradyrhizobium]WGR97815.1 hypothetical protein MTX23_26035 [Bradyrhizobium sp. ISRA436]WGS04704.1 hypothetical protein MTX18_26040 [Bradyrhizobium sp. ISRA437]WGS11585.1 hypothetical protein MTX26_26040 [Bradyrhizobium sp. ISRA443]WGS19074.1 hypothetical protein MTX22_31990 [Bradyrhizobium sp. ISRA463]WGS25907.1 hypothetical protein MTX19_29545 [Bradyrhizobium sp. ISRA464]
MITPVRRNWDAKGLFNSLTPAMFAAEPPVVRARWDKLWPDLYTEYDARYLQAELSNRHLIATSEAEAFLNAWTVDEERHTNGFIRIIELVAGGSERDLWERLDARPHDFSHITEFLKDEFALMVVIAFDEMCTCRAYAADKDFYAVFQNQSFVCWLRELIADEAVHSMNAVNVIRARYRGRVREAGAILDRLISGVVNDPTYRGTFLLDYFGRVYTKEMLARCRATILRNIAKPLTAAEQDELNRPPN